MDSAAETINGLVLTIGLPESGKTTFLAALLHCVSEGGPTSRLFLPEHVGEFASLRELERNWLECKPFGRTLESDETRSVLPLAHRATGKRYELVFPDLSGEQFDSQWRDRACTQDYAELVQRCAGVLLMINPEMIKETLPLEVVPDAFGAASAVPSADASFVSDWNADDAPTQVKLVDILQSLLALRGKREVMRLSIVVSLWDKVVAQNQSPSDVIRHRMPLLHQFVSACPRFEAEYFGVSAQGGDYAAERERLVAMRPIERIQIVSRSGESHDITQPIEWALGGERGA